MYAVITEGRLSYLGECRDEALATFNSKPNSTLRSVENVDELNDLLDIEEIDIEEELSEGFQVLVQKLDELGLNQNLVETVKSNGAKLVGEAKSLGIKSMKAVGEGFVALGELLRNATKDEECHEEDCCLHKHEHGGES
jgi:hypothetical protein